MDESIAELIERYRWPCSVTPAFSNQSLEQRDALVSVMVVDDYCRKIAFALTVVNERNRLTSSVIRYNPFLCSTMIL